MASIVLSAAGSVLGSATGIPGASALGGALGRTLGGAIDNRLFGGSGNTMYGARLSDLGVQTSTYGKTIPVLYGSVRISGNIIWARPIKETVTTTKSSAGGGGKGSPGKSAQKTTTYSYSATLAVAVCAGPVDEVLRIWADAKQLDVSQYNIRIYKGTEDQLPDSLMQSFDGADKTPAYRGMCYIVFEDFQLADYGNRIPNFTFEVQKKALYPDYNDELLEDMLTGVVLIPGAGEFVYDTQAQYKIPGAQVGAHWVQQGNKQSINIHTNVGKTNALVALDQLKNTCPNVDYVSVVVSWFGDSMDAGDCVLLPGVEFKDDAITSPDSWQVAGFSRSTARLITQIDGKPQYGGTPDDSSVLRLLDELRTRGYKVAFYPLMFMDVSGKPWRGEVTGSAADVSSFFTKTHGYNAFINHYASLVAGKVDAFIIGSELKGLTKVTNTPGGYPAVTQLISLAASVKTTLGSGVKVTYAADWSEYHHADGGWYHLDPLWASPNIDIIGIDAYFPLTDTPQSGYDIDEAITGWTSGEGYDWYYTDPERTTTASLSPEYAWKNIEWFWRNTHHNPGGAATSWVPESKKIWFTEFGFPSVDGANNQPNVFYDPTSTSSALPHFSRGRIDFRAQRTGLVATAQKWKDSEMVERMFAWTWDARPYPYWPDLTTVWADGAAWKTGHWLQGKLGVSSLAAIVSDLCKRAGLSENDIDVSRLSEQVEGFIITSQQTLRSAIEALQHGYFFDSVESDNVLKFVPRGGDSVKTLSQDELLAPQEEGGEAFTVTRQQEIELPRRVNIIYMNRLLNYQSSAQYSERQVTESREVKTLDFPIVFNDQIAKNICDITLFSDWVGRTSYGFDLPIGYATLEPSDIVTVIVEGAAQRMRIISTDVQSHGMMRVQAVAEDKSTFDFYTPPAQGSTAQQEVGLISPTRLELLDLPALPAANADGAVLHMAGAGTGAGWTGAAVYRSDDGGANYARFADVQAPASIGTALSLLASGATSVFDDVNMVDILMVSNDAQLQSITELAVLNGDNAALLGDEIIQFKNATLLAPGKYRLSGLLRGRLGTEWAIAAHTIGERFVLLDGTLEKQALDGSVIGLSRKYKPVTFGSSICSAAAQDFTYTARALKPYSPVHISGVRDGSGNLSISWIRRTRRGGNWQDLSDVPLGEEAESYDVEIISGSVIARTLSALSSPIASYSAAEQIADFGAVQSSVSVRIYQRSALVGRGYAGVASV